MFSHFAGKGVKRFHENSHCENVVDFFRVCVCVLVFSKRHDLKQMIKNIDLYDTV